MADDPAPGFRTELLAALEIVNPQIEGLDTLLQAGLSGDVNIVLQDTIAARRIRKTLIEDALVAMSNLIGNGYPALPGLTVSEVLAEELQKEEAAIAAAVAIFGPQLRASKIGISLGGATSKL